MGGLCPRPPARPPWPCPPSPVRLRLTGLLGSRAPGPPGTSWPSMEVPGPPVSGKQGETSVKWQLCYDMTAKMWWMVSAGDQDPSARSQWGHREGRWPKLLGLTLGLRGIPRSPGDSDLPEPLGPGGKRTHSGQRCGGGFVFLSGGCRPTLGKLLEASGGIQGWTQPRERAAAWPGPSSCPRSTRLTVPSVGLLHAVSGHTRLCDLAVCPTQSRSQLSQPGCGLRPGRLRVLGTAGP